MEAASGVVYWGVVKLTKVFAHLRLGAARVDREVIFRSVVLLVINVLKRPNMLFKRVE
jgi:hypothetical protein